MIDWVLEQFHHLASWFGMGETQLSEIEIATTSPRKHENNYDDGCDEIEIATTSPRKRCERSYDNVWERSEAKRVRVNNNM